MKQFQKPRALTLLLPLLMALLASCEVETFASGQVTDRETGEPVVGAHVMEIGVTKNSSRLLCEGFTDSTGRFEISAGLAGFGGRKVTLAIVVEMDSFQTFVTENQYTDLNIRIRHF